MKKAIFTLVCILACCYLFAANHCVGTYNIRVISDKDTADKAWVNRKDYVARIVAEKGYDIVGLQEMKPAQKIALDTLLPAYHIEFWGRDSHILGNVGEGVGVAFRTSRYTLLDKGHFFLSTDPDKALLSWDAGYRRVSVWVKLQDKTSGEVFYFCSTHLDNVGSIAKRNGARINVEKMTALAGQYPCFIVGDFNSSPTTYSVHYTFGAYFNDSKNVAQSVLTEPECTYSNWLPNYTAASRIDYVYVRKARVLTYEVIKETFGRTYTPSDHFAVQTNVELQPYAPTARLHVSANGSDAADGTAEHPFGTLGKAISVSQLGDSILVTADEFTTNIALHINHSLTFMGGYDSSFKRIVGTSTLSGQYNATDSTFVAAQLLVAAAPSLLHLENFALHHSNNTDAQGKGGAVQALGFGFEATNCTFSDNKTAGNGGAVYATGRLRIDSCIFADNKAGNGGAIAIEGTFWSYDVRQSLFETNEATAGAALYATGITEALLRGNAFISNQSTLQGTVCHSDAGVATVLTCVNNTFANNVCASANSFRNTLCGGSAVHFYAAENGCLNLLCNTITGNSTTCLNTDGSAADNFNGAAVFGRQGSLRMLGNIIAGNYATSACADAYWTNAATVDNQGYNIWTANIGTNIPMQTTDIHENSITTGLTAIGNLLQGNTEDGKFTANIEQLPHNAYVPFADHNFGSNDIMQLNAALLDENALNMDINNDGLFTAQLLTDQSGAQRTSPSAIGAMEYKPTTDIRPQLQDANISLRYINGKLHLEGATNGGQYALFDMTGRCLAIAHFNASETELAAPSAGCYIVCVQSNGQTITYKYVSH